MDSRKAGFRVRIELPESVKAVYRTDNPIENPVAYRLAQLHGLFRLVLRLHLLLVELGESTGRIGHTFVWHKRHTRMLHRLHLFTREAILPRKLLQVVDVRPVRVPQCSKLPGHRPAVARKHHTVPADHHRRLERALVKPAGHVPRHLLCVLVPLIVTVIHAVVVRVHREALRLGPSLRIVARRSRAALMQHIASLDALTVR